VILWRHRYREPVDRDEPVTTTFRAMGTDVSVLAIDLPTGAGERAAVAIERLEAQWSRFRPGSELCTLNDRAPDPVVVSDETYALVSLAIDAWRRTGGRYDPTVLPAVVAAGYDRDFASVAAEGPGPAAAPSPAPGCAGIRLDPVVRSIALPAGVALDLGGIGKGYAADLVSGELLPGGAHGGPGGVLVNLGGDLRARGAAPPPPGWVVSVDDPLATGRTGLLALDAGAIATSTRVRRAWQRDGELLHHLIDPRTGRPARSDLASVTIVAAEAWRAEVLAKAVFVAGADEGRALVGEWGATGLMVREDGGVEELAGLARFRP
jgi:thiamine biosynthesis lipoprotein